MAARPRLPRRWLCREWTAWKWLRLVLHQNLLGLTYAERAAVTAAYNAA